MRRPIVLCLLGSVVAASAGAVQENRAQPEEWKLSGKVRQTRNLRVHQEEEEFGGDFWETFLDPVLARMGDQSMSMPTVAPTDAPKSKRPTKTPQPTRTVPTSAPIKRTEAPQTGSPSRSPTDKPTERPRTRRPSRSPVTPRPTNPPRTNKPTERPTELPTNLTLFPTKGPVLPPSPVPTVAPIAPSNTPSTRRPSKSPVTFRPSKVPSSPRPTRQPASAPVSKSPTSRAPTSRPTPSPFRPEPTSRPTQLPTTLRPVAPVPTRRPTLAPAPLPTRRPTRAPTRAPVVATCDIELTTRCEECESLVPINPTCGGTPNQITMRFVGGSCQDSTTTQDIACFDFGTISQEPGTRAYIVVQFGQTVYFSGFVRVGQDYVIQAPNGGTLGQSQSIVVYRSDDLSPDNVLQSLVYVGDCTEPIRLKARFGASQVVGFRVGGVSTNAFEALTVTQQVRVPPTSDSAVELVSLATQSNIRTFNLTDTVAGTNLQIGQATAFNFDITVDVTIPREYNFVSAVSARTNAGATCSSVSLYSFRTPALSTQSATSTEADSESVSLKKENHAH